MLEVKKKGKTDEGCNNTEKEFEINPHKFFKIIFPHILHHKTLSIPETFAKNFIPELPTFATLTIRTGLSWKIALERIENKLYFTQGWADFMEQNAIKYNYCLEFEYQGNGHFKVHIFNLTCTDVLNEIEYPLEYHQYSNHIKIPRNQDHDVNEDVIMVQDEDEDEGEMECLRLESMKINPSFTTSVKNYNIRAANSFLSIPKAFSNKYMKRKLYKIAKLQTGDGREWYVSCKVYQQGTFFLAGIIWEKFMTENQWYEHEGENYTFVLLDKKPNSLTFKVIKDE